MASIDPRLTPDVVKKYILNGGVRCPFCHSDNIETMNTSSDDSGVYRKVECHDCGEWWLDVYTLSGLVYDEEWYDREGIPEPVEANTLDPDKPVMVIPDYDKFL